MPAWMPTTPVSTHWLNACGQKLPPDSLVIVDKGFYSASLLWPLQHRQGRHWLIPARAGLRGEVGANAWPWRCELAHEGLAPSSQERPGLPLTWEVRAITRELDGKPEPCSRP